MLTLPVHVCIAGRMRWVIIAAAVLIVDCAQAGEDWIKDGGENAKGTVIAEFHDEHGKFIGFVKFFGNHEWRFYKANGQLFGTIDDREGLCLQNRDDGANCAALWFKYGPNKWKKGPLGDWPPIRRDQ